MDPIGRDTQVGMKSPGVNSEHQQRGGMAPIDLRRYLSRIYINKYYKTHFVSAQKGILCRPSPLSLFSLLSFSPLLFHKI